MSFHWINDFNRKAYGEARQMMRLFPGHHGGACCKSCNDVLFADEAESFTDRCIRCVSRCQVCGEDGTMCLLDTEEYEWDRALCDSCFILAVEYEKKWNVVATLK